MLSFSSKITKIQNKVNIILFAQFYLFLYFTKFAKPIKILVGIGHTRGFLEIVMMTSSVGEP